MTPGKSTSEHKLAWVGTALSMVAMIAGALVAAFGEDTVAGAILGAVGAAAQAFTASSYAQSRGMVKAAQSQADAIMPPTMSIAAPTPTPPSSET